MYKKKILIVEDEETIATLEKEILEGEGFEVEVTKDGEEGLERIKKNGYDLIISDFQMPRMKGDEFYLKVRNLSQGLEKRIIFVSGSTNDFIESTGNRFLAKPFSIQQLLQTVRESVTHMEAKPKAKKINLMDFIVKAEEASIGKAIREFSHKLPQIEIIQEKEDLIKAYVSTSVRRRKCC
jgi:DNA-binding response OmpR family regulator